MRNFLRNKHGDMNMVLTAVVLAITLAISIVIVWNVMGSIDTTSVDAALRKIDPNTNVSRNATESISENLEIFYTISPIILIVVAAVAILGYVLLLRRT
jgi:heme/copper-type cytochrome/quinol oxidase subunit 2